MTAFKKTTVLAFLLLVPTYLPAQETTASVISGTVTDAETGNPLPGVNVYINGSASGTSTNTEGEYRFRTTITGKQQLIFSFVGYKTVTRTVDINTQDTLSVNSSLDSRTVEMDEVEVTSSNREWRRSYDFFKKQFLGRTDFSNETEIKNSWVLEFHTDGNLLTAISDRPLHIVNHALGYEIHVELIQFEWNTRSEVGIYKALTRYEELGEEDDTEEKKKWKKNRIETYYGSKRHFFQTLYKGDLEDSPYSLGKRNYLTRLTEGELKYEFIRAGMGTYQPDKKLKGFKLAGRLPIKYRHVLNYQIDGEQVTSRLRKRSAIEPAKEHRMFFINKRGLLEDPASVRLYGHWAETRMANDLPIDFTHNPE